MAVDGEQARDDERKDSAPKDVELGSHFLRGDFIIFKVQIIPLDVSPER